MDDIINAAPRVAELGNIAPADFAALASDYRPTVLRGVAQDWPGVRAARAGTEAMAAYLRRFDGGRPLRMFAAGPDADGRFFYDDRTGGFNFRKAQVTLPILIDALIAEQRQPRPAAIYAGSAPAPEAYPGWAEENVLSLPTPGAVPRVWLGNGSRASTHYDMSDNIAVVVSGRRRFALFPPDQGPNLYVGPLENTIAGQPTSMVDLERPDFHVYPRFHQALATMQVAELEPGDALFIPSLWWHDVRADGPLNVLVNYWWGQSGEASPFAALMHAVMAIRHLPPGQRAALRTWFDHYVFADDAVHAADHLASEMRGVLGPPSPERNRSIRNYLLRMLAQTGQEKYN